MKKAMLVFALSGACLTTFAQEEVALTPKTKKIEHRVGVQMNELIRQVFNFNNTASNINNPYLLIYSINHARTGWGIRVGAGYALRTISDDNGINKVETKIDDLNARLGIEKAFKLSDKWNTGAGLDFIYGKDANKTTSILRGFDTVTTKTTNNIKTLGGGPMAWLRYHITDKILIGTEASIYYTTGTEKKVVEITRRETNFPPQPPTTTITNVDNKLSEVNIGLPVAFYLIVRF